MKKTLTILIFSFFNSSIFAQGQVSGTAVDQNTQAVQSATIMLLNAADSSVAKMSITDKSGNYSFDGVGKGRYFVAASAIGHQKEVSKIFEISAGDFSLAAYTIVLIAEPKSIGGVTVVAKRPLIEQKSDRTVINVDASITNTGNSALEVLEKSPGVSVDKDGNVSLKGKQGVMIYIDGRPSYLTGADLANMLRNMNAGQLDQVEIMTNPSAKYDAAGNSGVINIKTKKNKQAGYNGSLTSGYTQGHYARFNEGLNMNYRNGKVNIFSNLNYSSSHTVEDLDILRKFHNTSSGNISSIIDQYAEMHNESRFYNAKIGADYSLTKKTTVGITLNGFYNPSNWNANTKTYLKAPNGDLQGLFKAHSINIEKWKNYSNNINFRSVLDSAGQELSGDFDYIQYCSTSLQPLYSQYFDKTGIPVQASDTLQGDLPQHIKIYSGKIDYVRPVKGSAKLEAGIKYSFVKTDNNAAYHTILDGHASLDSGHSDHFMYDENINAAYVNYSRPLGKKWNGQLGLRLENTNINGYSAGYEFDNEKDQFVTSTKTFKKHYTQLFPTLFLHYTANENNQFGITYGRRVNRPDYKDLNPFVYFLDKYTFSQGNPKLKPQFSHTIELSHTYKGFITTTANYTQTTDIIQQVLEQNNTTSETYLRKANIASLKQVGLSVNAYKEFNKWWSGNIYVNISNNHFAGIVNNDPVSIRMTGVLLQAQQQFKLGKGWSAELSGFYRSKFAEGVIIIEALGQINTGFSKQVLNNKASIKLNVKDLFAMGNVKGYSKYSVVDTKFRNGTESRVISLGFTWKFNKGIQNNSGQHKSGGAGDEQERVNAGAK